MTIWRLRTACWTPKATNTHTHTHSHRLCNTYCFSTATMAARTRLKFTLYVYCASCYLTVTSARRHTIKIRIFIDPKTDVSAANKGKYNSIYIECYRRKQTANFVTAPIGSAAADSNNECYYRVNYTLDSTLLALLL